MSYQAFNFLGDDRDTFMKSSWKIYNNLSGTSQYIGKTSNDKTFNPNLALTEWWDNTSGTQSLFVLDIQKFDFAVSFQIMQVLDPNMIPLAWNFQVDKTSNPGYTRAYQGSQPPPLLSSEWQFVGRSRSGLAIILVLRNAICVANGEWKVGTPGEYSGIPVTVRALQDTTQTDKSDDMVYVLIQNEAS